MRRARARADGVTVGMRRMMAATRRSGALARVAPPRRTALQAEPAYGWLDNRPGAPRSGAPAQGGIAMRPVVLATRGLVAMLAITLAIAVRPARAAGPRLDRGEVAVVRAINRVRARH